MTRAIRYGEYLRNISLVEHQISYNQLTPDIRFDTNGKIIPHVAPAVTLNSLDVFRLIKTHAQGRFMEQFRVVIPLAAYLIVFLIFILKQIVSAPLGMAFGLLGVIIGLMLFLEGLKLGLMPLGEAIGHTLPRKSTLPAVLTVAFILGVGVTFAEPAIGALQTAGQLISVENAPYLYAILNDWSGALVLVVGCGVGLAAILGTLRFIYGWSLKPMIYLTLVPALGLSLYASSRPELQKVLGLAWDCGAVTTGPVTVPLVLVTGYRYRHRDRQGQCNPLRLRHRYAGLPVSHYRCAGTGHLHCLLRPRRDHHSGCHDRQSGCSHARLVSVDARQGNRAGSACNSSARRVSLSGNETDAG